MIVRITGVTPRGSKGKRGARIKEVREGNGEECPRSDKSVDVQRYVFLKVQIAEDRNSAAVEEVEMV